MSAINYLSQHILTPLHNSWRGFGEINSQVKHWERSFELPLCEVKEVESQMLSSLLHCAYDNCEFYKKRFDSAGLADVLDHPEEFRRIPMLTKSEIRENSTALLNNSLPKASLIETQTGGSTGDPMVFHRDKTAYSVRWGLQTAANMRLGWNPGEWYALICGAPRDLPEQFTTKYWLTNYLIHRQIIMNAGMINDELVSWFVLQLQKRHPRVIYGYTMMIELIAEALNKSGADFPKPDVVIVTAETLTSQTRETIEATFKAPVINRYASREFGLIADQCSGTPYMRVVPASLKLEILPLSESDPDFGELVITDLVNRATPFIRYRTGDVARLTEREVNGVQGLYMSELSGRVSDFLVTPKGKVISSIALLPDFFTPHPHIRQAQILQRTKSDFIILVVSEKSEPNQEDALSIAETLEQVLEEKVNVEVDFVQEIPNDLSGKTRFIKSEISPQLFKESAL